MSITDREVHEYEEEIKRGMAVGDTRNGLRIKAIDDCMKKLVEAIKIVPLQHVDLSNMGLRDKAVELVDALT